MELSLEEDVNFQFLYYHVHEFSGPVGWGIDTLSSTRPADVPRTYPVTVFSTVNGYHVYRTRPPVGLPLNIVPEPDNPFDRNALRIQVPSIGDINRVWHREEPIVLEMAGNIVGRAPMQLAGILSPFMRSGYVKNVTVFHTGRMLHDGPLRGGGPKLSACYYINTVNRTHLVEQLRAAGFPSDDVLL